LPQCVALKNRAFVRHIEPPVAARPWRHLDGLTGQRSWPAYSKVAFKGFGHDTDAEMQPRGAAIRAGIDIALMRVAAFFGGRTMPTWGLNRDMVCRVLPEQWW